MTLANEEQCKQYAKIDQDSNNEAHALSIILRANFVFFLSALGILFDKLDNWRSHITTGDFFDTKTRTSVYFQN